MRPNRAGPSKNPWDYPSNPVGYANHILGVNLTPDQEAILRSLLAPPYKTLVPSGHDVGKTFCAAVAANWWYDSFDPGLVLSTAPTEKDVIDLLWAEIRLQRQRAPVPLSDDFIGPAAPHMRTSPDHYAKGYTARKGESFQGRHRPRMLFIFDEANGIDPIYWQATRSMFDPALGHAWLAIYNPTTTTSQAYIEANGADAEGNPRWSHFRLSAANHPNLRAELDGKPRPVPSAVSLSMFEKEWLQDWCEPVAPGDGKVTDFAWPPVEWCRKNGREPKWYRPGPVFQGRALGLDPDTGDGVWSDALWNACLGPPPPWPLGELPVAGCDTATGKGEDYHAIAGRWGATVVRHTTANTMDPVRIADALKQTCKFLADLANRERQKLGKVREILPTEIPVNIDDDATGNAIKAILQHDGYTVNGIGAGTKARKWTEYPRKRDELWFETADKARAGLVNFSCLDRKTQRRLKQQLMAVKWDLKGGQRCVEKKDDTKEKIGRSPDDADATNLAFYPAPSLIPEQVEPQGPAHAGGHYGRGRR